MTGKRAKTCPRCGSPYPDMTPAVFVNGEFTKSECNDPFHTPESVD